MNDDPSSLRDQTIFSLTSLTEAFGAEVKDESSEAEAALRHLGIAGLNLATESDPDHLLSAGRALSWVALFLMWQRSEVAVDELVERIVHQDLVRHIGPGTLRRRLRRADQHQSSRIRRAPTGEHDTDEWSAARCNILSEIVEHDRRIAALVDAPAHHRRDALIGDAGLLATALEISAEDREVSGSHSLVELLPEWSVEAPGPALEILARFEGAQFENVPSEFEYLDERSRRFEQSLATHLERHDILSVLRAALAFAPAPAQPLPREQQLRRYLTGFSPFAADPTLLDLAIALITVRHRALDHLRGARSLDALSPWISYLRGPCTHFAEAREITLREATNFAHYAFHLLNLCDVASLSDVVVRDPLRRALMDLEEELKEFALVGQRQGLSDEQSDLHRYEETRWRNEGSKALLADRIARLSGLWQAGHRSGPPGSPPRLDHERFERLCEQFQSDQASPEVDAAAHLIRRAQFRGHQWLESWNAGDILPLLITVLSAARRAPQIDIDHRFTIDLSPLGRWLEADDHQRRTDILRTLLTARSDQQLAHTPLLQRSVGLCATADEQLLSIDFCSSRSFEALLILLADADEDDTTFSDALLKRIDDQLHQSTEVAFSSPRTFGPQPPQ